MAVTKTDRCEQEFMSVCFCYYYFKKLQEMFVDQENFLSTVDTY